jgi:hypothetical protein
VAPVEVEGVVEAQLPAALYTVRLDGSERRVTAHLAAGLTGTSSACCRGIASGCGSPRRI